MTASATVGGAVKSRSSADAGHLGWLTSWQSYQQRNTCAQMLDAFVGGGHDILINRTDLYVLRMEFEGSF